MRPLLVNDHFVVEDLTGKALRITRLGRPFLSKPEVESACQPVQRTLDRLGRADYVVLLDSREARGSNNPQHEEWFAAHRAQMVKGFRLVAILMRTAIGALHSDRVTRTDGTRKQIEIFQDINLACAYLGIPVPPTRSWTANQ